MPVILLAVVIHLFAVAVSSEYPSAGLVSSCRLWCIYFVRDTEKIEIEEIIF